jgi:hypothetical protein
MPSGKIPKLVVRKKHSPSRKLKLPDEIVAEEQEGQIRRRSRTLTRATLVVKQAKTALHTNMLLILAGLCAAVVMFGVVTAVTSSGSVGEAEGAEDAGPSMTSMRPAGEEPGVGPPVSAQPGVTVVWDCVNEDEQIYRKITTGGATNKTESVLYRKVVRDGPNPTTIWVPVHEEEKPEVVPSDELDRIRERREENVLTPR